MFLLQTSQVKQAWWKTAVSPTASESSGLMFSPHLAQGLLPASFCKIISLSEREEDENCTYLEILFTVESIINNVHLPCDNLTAHGTDMSNFLK